jgi:uncharacterized protein (DUF1778 family)
MEESTVAKPKTQKPKTSWLTVCLDAESKQVLREAAKLRRVSISEYVRTVTMAQARREIASAKDQSIRLSPDEQLAFWEALQAQASLTPAQKRLGTLMMSSSRPWR